MKEKKKTQKEVLIENAEEVIEMIREDFLAKEIAKKFGVDADAVTWFVAESGFSARAKTARLESAENIRRKAEKVLLDIQADDTQASVTRQRELAHHYRWLAAKKNPKEYGDSTKIQAEVKDTSSTSTWLGEVLNEIDNNK